MHPPTFLHLATSEMRCWSGGRGVLNKTVSVLQYIVFLYYYNGALRYEQFLQIGRLYQAFILLGLALSSDRLLKLFSYVIWST